MIIYNVTIQIDKRVADDWLFWMRSEHIPEVINTGLFVSYRLLRIQQDDDEQEGLTFAVQYTSLTQEHFDTYVREYATDLQKKHRERYHNSFIAIRTIMHVVEEKVIFASDS